MRERNGILGRAKLVVELTGHVLAGHTVLLFGPYGIGKTTVLALVREQIRASGRPCAFSPATRHLQDVTRALADAYVEASRARNQRTLRARLQLAIEARPGVLLLDDLRSAGTALKGFLRSLEGTGLGTIIAADAENERDHMGLRARRLAFREVAVPGLPQEYMRSILERELTPVTVRTPLVSGDRTALLDIASGRPGVLRFLVSCLRAERFWHGERPRVEMLRSEATMATGLAYVRG
jgi:hypothetical protein